MTAPTALPNLTQYERLGIDRDFNLADGHAHQFQDAGQRDIVRKLAVTFAESERTRQGELERAFQERFYALAGQSSAAGRPHTLLCYSASTSIDLVAAFLSARGATVNLLRPCFDNLPGILRRRGAALRPVGERELTGPGLEERLRAPGPQALFLTLPNNPTGFALDEAAFTHVARCCAATGTILVVDWTFRFFAPYETWDQYAVLARAGTSYLCVEDTGKTWPTLDLKCSILAASEDLYGPLYELHNDILLNVSPFVLHLVTRYLEDTARRGLEATVRGLVRNNRLRLREALEGTGLAPVRPDGTISVEWVRIGRPALTSLDVVRMLGDAGVAVLPGDHFHWDDPRAGSRYVRFALARDTSLFAEACARVAAVLRGTARPGGGGAR
ncbi:MAG: aminotransferase class I/II-fold pyridoxal phosphate-dependent enzyme [Streptomyces sp.]|nr:aminotransferase class I/II-fold pyridoxal phosphate-dependent enzyme [Streptomyces sp.]